VRGQAGLGCELVEQVSDLALVVVPIGGGGLAGGVAWAVKHLRPQVRVVGVQSAAWPAAARSVAAGSVVAVAGSPTLADGIAIKRPGGLTLPLLDALIDEIVEIDDDDVGEAMVFLAERAKLVAEGAGAVAVAALLTGAIAPARHGRTVAVVSGGNVDPRVLAAVIGRHETTAGRRLRLFTEVPDRPGGLADLLGTVASAGGNLLDVAHVRDGVPLHVGETGVELLVETRGGSHVAQLIGALKAVGYAVTPLNLDR
jgi:threonine dehydratase